MAFLLMSTKPAGDEGSGGNARSIHRLIAGWPGPDAGLLPHQSAAAVMPSDKVIDGMKAHYAM